MKRRPCAEVVGELVGQIDAGGYFDETIGGQEKNIVLRLESGSSAPAGFLDGLADAARSTVETRQIGSQTMTLDGDDMDDAYAAQGYISAGAASSCWRPSWRGMTCSSLSATTTWRTAIMKSPLWQTGSSTSLRSTPAPAK